MLQLILLLLHDILGTVFLETLEENWNVQIPYSVCGVRGSNVTIPCNFTYPKNGQVQVTQVLWCSKRQHEQCDRNGPYVYNSAYIHNQSNYEYIGNNISNCCLMISDINSTNSGEYLFRFITTLNDGRFTSEHGVDVTIKDLNVSMSRSRDNGSITVGDSLNLTCTVSCPGHSPELQWFKDNEPTTNSGPILTFKSVNHKDSGNYSCALKFFKSSESKQISLYVEGTDSVSSDTSGSTTYFWVIGVCCLVSIIILIVVAVTLISRRRAKIQEMQKEGKTAQINTVTQTVQTNLQRTQDVLHEEEVQYASLNIKPKEVWANTEQQKEDSTIYSTVRVHEVKGEM